MITIPITMCGACNLEEETSDHILISCNIATTIMDSILAWCDIRCDRFLSVKDVLLFISWWSNYKLKRRMLYTILSRVLWCIWTDRNKMIFDNSPLISANTMERIQATTFIWSKYTGTFKKMEWKVWNLCPFLCL